MEKGATAAPFYRRVRSAYRFLPAFFFPPLAFFAIVCYPPLHVGMNESAHAHHCGCRLARSPDVGARRFRAPSDFHLEKWKGELERCGRASLGMA
jgi:hypothetical protein